MITQIRLQKSIRLVVIGDDERDIETANNADMRGILVDDNYKLIDAVNDILQ